VPEPGTRRFQERPAPAQSCIKRGRRCNTRGDEATWGLPAPARAGRRRFSILLCVHRVPPAAHVPSGPGVRANNGRAIVIVAAVGPSCCDWDALAWPLLVATNVSVETTHPERVLSGHPKSRPHLISQQLGESLRGTCCWHGSSHLGHSSWGAHRVISCAARRSCSTQQRCVSSVCNCARALDPCTRHNIAEVTAVDPPIPVFRPARHDKDSYRNVVHRPHMQANHYA
jgi:hypothetical protein